MPPFAGSSVTCSPSSSTAPTTRCGDLDDSSIRQRPRLRLPGQPTHDVSAHAAAQRRVLGAAGAASPLLSTQVAFAAPDYTGDTLIVLSMRGGFDGISAVVPHGDPDYATWRSATRVPTNKLLAGTIDPLFGLHPSFAPLLPYWTAGTFGVVQACGLWAPDRSHFEAQAEMERAAPGSSTRSGWLDRVIGVNGLTGSSFQAVQVGDTLPPDSLLGPNPELAMDSLTASGSPAGRTRPAGRCGTPPCARCTQRRRPLSSNRRSRPWTPSRRSAP